MTTGLIATIARIGPASAAADTGTSLDRAWLAGLALLGLTAAAILQFAVHGRRRERNSPGALKQRAKARRYNQP